MSKDIELNVSITLVKTVKAEDGAIIECHLHTGIFVGHKIADIDFNAVHERLDNYADCALQKYYEGVGPAKLRSPEFNVPMKGKPNALYRLRKL